METDLRALPNVGAAVAAILARVGIERPEDLRGQTAERLYQRLCEADGHRHDPCLRDTLVAIFDYANGAPARPWWYYSRLRVDARSAAQYEALADTPLRPDTSDPCVERRPRLLRQRHGPRPHRDRHPQRWRGDRLDAGTSRAGAENG
jgi:hypothetical protein